MRACFRFPPLYSPDPKPIIGAFAKLEAHLRRIGASTIDARIIDALWRAAGGSIRDLHPPNERWNDLKAAGYASG